MASDNPNSSVSSLRVCLSLVRLELQIQYTPSCLCNCARVIVLVWPELAFPLHPPNSFKSALQACIILGNHQFIPPQLLGSASFSQTSCSLCLSHWHVFLHGIVLQFQVHLISLHKIENRDQVSPYFCIFQSD